MIRFSPTSIVYFDDNGLFNMTVKEILADRLPGTDSSSLSSSRSFRGILAKHLRVPMVMDSHGLMLTTTLSVYTLFTEAFLDA